MNIAEKYDILYRILSGNVRFELNGTIYVVKTPSITLLQKANHLYSKTLYQESFNDSWLKQYEINGLLLRNELITLDQEKRLENLHEQIENVKVSMYENALNSAEVSKLKTKIEILKKQSSIMFYNQHMLDYITAEGYAGMVKNQYIASHTLYYEDDTRVFTDEVDFQLLEAVMHEINMLTLSYAQIREFSRTEPWKAYWSAQKDLVFGIPAAQWNDDQRLTVSCSRMYDSISEHSECPSDKIIDDDDMLDGWMIVMRRNNERNRKQEEIEKLLGDKLKSASDVFLPVSKPGQYDGVDPAFVPKTFEKEDIESMNDPLGTKIKQQRAAVIAKHGEINDADLPDIQLDRLNQGK